MAGAETHKRVFKLEDIVVPEWMIKGNKFIKWDEETNTVMPVTLRIDEHGHFLYWKNQLKDTDCLELTSLRDTRFGKYANVPKDAKLREACVMGSPDTPLEEKTVTIIYGSDMVTNNTLNLCSNSDKITQEWADMILKISYHRSAQYPSPYKLLEKIYTKLTIMVNKEGKIPLKSIKKMFASSREDKKKVDNALQAAGVLMDKKDDTIAPNSFRLQDFFTFYTRLISQKEIDKVFQGLGAKNKPYLTAQQVIKFLNEEQRDPRLNEVLYPFYDTPRAKDLITRFEPNKAFMKKGQLSVDGLLRYLLSDENSVVGPDAYLLCHDMEHSIAHYFINSSHNTYLTGHQLTGKSSVEMYRQALLFGCRCVELDCWDGKAPDDEPIITHGYTMCTEVLFKDVIEAIKETAFKTTDFPVILSFENHCSPKQQAKMANYCRVIFGDSLLIDALEENPLDAAVPLPSPNALRGKILVKNKKRKVIDGGKKRSVGRLASRRRRSLTALVMSKPQEEPSVRGVVRRAQSDLSSTRVPDANAIEKFGRLTTRQRRSLSTLVTSKQEEPSVRGVVRRAQSDLSPTRVPDANAIEKFGRLTSRQRRSLTTLVTSKPQEEPSVRGVVRRAQSDLSSTRVPDANAIEKFGRLTSRQRRSLTTLVTSKQEEPSVRGVVRRAQSDLSPDANAIEKCQKKAGKEGERKGRARLISASSFSSNFSFDDDDPEFVIIQRTSRRGAGRRLSSQSSVDSDVSVFEPPKIVRGVSRKASKRSHLLQIDEKDADTFSPEDSEVSVGSNLKVRRESQTASPNTDNEAQPKRRESQPSKKPSIGSVNGEDKPLVTTRTRRIGQVQCPVLDVTPQEVGKPRASPRGSPSSSPRLPKKGSNSEAPKNESVPAVASETPKRAKRRASHTLSNLSSISQGEEANYFEGRSASTPASKTFSTDSDRSIDSSMSRATTDALEEVEEESDSDDDEENMSKEEVQRYQMEKREKGTAGQEAEAGREMSALVNYIQPVHFHTFEAAEKRNRSYEISSFVETSAMNRVKENPIQFNNYNKRQMSRIYPRGTRVDSSNYMPQIFWNVGCQMVALNYQTLDLPMQLNMGYFEINGRSGYILKPEFMRRKDRVFDPFAESIMDGIVAATVEVRVISGQFLSDRRVNTYVEVDMFGLPADTVRKRYKTKSQTSSSLNPTFDNAPFIFKKVIMPELAMLRIAVFEDNGKMVGHRILPVESLRPGYRHIFLFNEANQPLMLPTLFLNIKVRDYVPEKMSNFADALANPIAHQSKVEKHAAQLQALEDEEVRQVKEQVEAKEQENEENKLNGEQTPVERKESAATSISNTAASNTGTGNYRKNTIPQSEPNGLKTNSKLQASSTAISPATSLGEDLAIPRSRSLGTAQFQKESMASPLNQNNRSISAPNLGQSEEIQAAKLEDIKEHKKYKKVVIRLNLELEKLIKKEERKQSKMKKAHVKELAKMRKSQEKGFKSLSKKQANQLKKAAKKGQNLDEMRQQLNEVKEAFKRDKENEYSKKQAAQETALIELYKKHYADERDLKKEHAEILYELQMELMVAVHEKQLAKLDHQHKKEEVELRKRLDEKNVEDLKQMSKRGGNKHELSRLRRENQQKYIQQAVGSRQTLHEIQQKKHGELEDEMRELQEALAAEEDTHSASIEAEYSSKCKKLMNDLKSNEESAGDTVIVAHSNGIAAGQEEPVALDNGVMETQVVIESHAGERSAETGEVDLPCPTKITPSSSTGSSQSSSGDPQSSAPESNGSQPPSPAKSTTKRSSPSKEAIKDTLSLSSQGSSVDQQSSTPKYDGSEPPSPLKSTTKGSPSKEAVRNMTSSSLSHSSSEDHQNCTPKSSGSQPPLLTESALEESSLKEGLVNSGDCPTDESNGSAQVSKVSSRQESPDKSTPSSDSTTHPDSVKINGTSSPGHPTPPGSRGASPVKSLTYKFEYPEEITKL